MDISSILQPFLSTTATLLSGPQFVAATIAQIALALMKEINFDPAKAMEVLGKIGFRIGQELLPDFLQAAKAGIKSLTQWFVERLSTPEVNAATAQALVQQAEPIATAVQMYAPGDKGAIAAAMQEGLVSYGGATGQIAVQYAEVIKDIKNLRQLMEEMQDRVNSWSSMTIEAKNSSLVRGIEMYQEGGSHVKQSIRAEDHSQVENVTMRQVEGSGPKSSQPPFPKSPPKPASSQ